MTPPVEVLFSSLAVRAPDSPWARRGAGPVGDVLDFGGGVPDPCTYPLTLFDELLPAVLREDGGRALAYDTSPGFPGLQQALAERLRGRRVESADPAQIGVVNGSAGAMAVVASVFVDPGDVVVAERLTWPGAVRAFRLLGAAVEYAPVDDDGLDPDALEELLSDIAERGRRVKLLYTIATAHNPTGTTQPLERRMRIIDIARRFGAVVVQDDAYGELWLDNDGVPPYLALAPERTVHIGSFSKTIAPGLRVGWTAASPEISGMLAKARTELGTTPVLQRAVAHFMERGHYDAHLAEVTELYRTRRDVLLEALKEYCAPYCRWNEPHAGFYIWVTLEDGEVSDLLADASRERVGFMPGSYFSPDGPAPPGFRLSFSSLPPEDLREGARRLGLALAAHAGRRST